MKENHRKAQSFGEKARDFSIQKCIDLQPDKTVTRRDG